MAEKQKVMIAWTCGVNGHLHKTEAQAAACVEKRFMPKPPRKPGIIWTEAMKAQLLAERQGGATLKDLATKHGRTAENIRQVLNRYERSRS